MGFMYEVVWDIKVLDIATIINYHHAFPIMIRKSNTRLYVNASSTVPI